MRQFLIFILVLLGTNVVLAMFGSINWVHTWYHPESGAPAASLAEDFALTGRLDFVGVPGLLLGGSVKTRRRGRQPPLAVRLPDRTEHGRFTGLDEKGGLLLSTGVTTRLIPLTAMLEEPDC